MSSKNTEFCLRWDLHKQNFSEELSQLQQNEELVDMTLAVDGYLVKVHKTLMALASPYFKEILRSLNPYQYPVIYLNKVDKLPRKLINLRVLLFSGDIYVNQSSEYEDVNHETLQLILQYIYYGEVHIDREKLPNFIKTARDLKIKGVENIIIPPMDQHKSKPVSISAPCFTDNAVNTNILSDKQNKNVNNDVTNEEAFYDYPIQINTNPPDICQLEELNNVDFITNFDQNLDTIDYGQVDLSTDLITNPVNLHLSINEDGHVNIIPNANVSEYTDEYTMETSTSATNDEPVTRSSRQVTTSNSGDLPLIDVTQYSDQIKYSISVKGSIQILLNDFIYRPHHNSKVKGVSKCRWRCITYRTKACKAFMDSDDGVLKSGYIDHNHASHVSKVQKKYSDKNVYNTIHEAIVKSAEKK